MGTPTLLDDRYLVGELIGSGGMADVHRAVDTRLGRPVAVKLFHPKADGGTVARLDTEARLLAGLSHPGVVRVFDVAVDNEHPYLVMHLVEGGTLRDRLDRGSLPAADVAAFGARLADILGYVHSNGIVHRDVKPSNVLIDDEGACYLADFGIARALGGARLTSTGHCVGTAAYLAPEQVRGQLTGPAGDIYSLGLVLLECLTGATAYEGSDIEAAIARLTRDPEIPDWLPTAWAEVITAMTRREPDDRPDAAECVRLLATAAGSDPVQAPSPAPRPVRRDVTAQAPMDFVDEPHARRTPSRLVHASLMAGAVLIGGAAVLLSTGSSTADPSPTPAAVTMTTVPTTTQGMAPMPMGVATGVIEVPTVQTKVVTITREERPRFTWPPYPGGWGDWGYGG
ncbi:serine/threonine-protein kinase [Actinokineospora cianjurensis]|uniref:non-specific serine/threonine protein kinase n=1 Tax=Actinokineospora cianjurensis TaxID=585224 RepID=A0A421B9K3_9PSEU|nr:serine/threonine-protein kinase [Actinokineospora cianjurensis]RLK61216.1 serine/threonine protein kinase [Actinokineospora cianjurensis]